MFSRDAKANFGLESLVADLDDYDYDDLAALGSDYTVVLFIATAGEGEPTTNAGRFWKYLEESAPGEKLQKLQYAAFGLGSSSYRLFNQAVKAIDQNLIQAGAHRLGQLGLGDDGKGTLEDDYLQWRAATVPIIAANLGLQRKPYVYKPALYVNELKSLPKSPILDGEPNKAQLYGRVKGPFTSTNPYPAQIKSHRCLSSPKSARQCIHVEFDISGTTLNYSTGDHLAITPTNSDVEVDRFLRTFGLQNRKHTVIDITTEDPSSPSPIPTFTTYKAAVSKYMNICGPVSRQALSVLARLTTDATAARIVSSLANDADAFAKTVREPHLNLAQLLQSRTPLDAWKNIDFAVLLELVGPLRSRHYSISSSSIALRKTISATIVEEKRFDAGWDFEFNGVSTSYLSELLGPTEHPVSSRVTGPNNTFQRPTAYISVRKSQFRLPKQCHIPIIMIGPGTGVAPFRAFVQERAHQSRQGKNIGKTVLFFGCRREDEDFLYKDEWSVSTPIPLCI
jgi:NADPH-ferrihemoprotein reductase